MPTNSNKTPRPDLSAIIEGLLMSDIQFILVGGLAAVIQGAPVTTMDVDIVHQQSSNNISKLFDFLTSIHAIYRRPDNKIIPLKKADLSSMGHILSSTHLGPIDVLAYIEHEKTFEDLISHTVDIPFRGHTLHVLDLKTLVELKKQSNDPKDRQRLAVLEETLRQLEE